MSIDTEQPASTDHGHAEPPTLPAAPPAVPKRGRYIMIIVAIVALLVGIGSGFALGLPARNDLTDQKHAAVQQRDAAKASLAKASASVKTANARITALQSQLARATSDAQRVSSAAQSCKTAAVDAGDLEAQWQNLFFEDFQQLSDLSNAGQDTSALEAHIRAQLDSMQAQARTVADETTACRTAAP